MIVIDSENIDSLDSDAIAKKAQEKFLNSKEDLKAFRPEIANPIYSSIPQYKKVNE